MSLPDPREKPTLTVPEAGAILGLGRDASYGAVDRGDLPAIRVGGRIVVPTAALLQLLHLNERHGPPAGLADALSASRMEMQAALEEVDRAMSHLGDAITGARQVAALLSAQSAARSSTDRAGATTTSVQETPDGCQSATVHSISR